MWKIINDIAKPNAEKEWKLIENNIVIEDENEIANVFNNFLTCSTVVYFDQLFVCCVIVYSDQLLVGSSYTVTSNHDNCPFSMMNEGQFGVKFV